jgi:small subunit ribosomal protein S4
MGDPKRLRKKYSTPNHPWQKLRIEEEQVLMKDYFTKNKKELWMMASKLKNFKNRVKSLVPKHDAQAELEKKQLMERIESLGLIKTGAKLEDVLGLTIKELMERRLQTVVFRKGFAKTIKNARQLVTHGHVYIDNKLISSPSYLVSVKEEQLVKISDKMKVVEETPAPVKVAEAKK